MRLTTAIGTTEIFQSMGFFLMVNPIKPWTNQDGWTPIWACLILPLMPSVSAGPEGEMWKGS